jgi:predicted dithiol-disulfide oxidoreductase (DUF899 family)
VDFSGRDRKSLRQRPRASRRGVGTHDAYDGIPVALDAHSPVALGPRERQVIEEDAAPRRRGGVIACFLHRGDRFFPTYETTGRGVEAIMSSHKLLDLTAVRSVGHRTL